MNWGQEDTFDALEPYRYTSLMSLISHDCDVGHMYCDLRIYH
jgi:hypothetical protein